ncbi:MAG: glycosyltransferase family 4 protein [Verrucomicrobiaceae bacterium]|nr:MAG: glycosyltransferase family 4 protein [Verrucomicrobiaceae bacterium]
MKQERPLRIAHISPLWTRIPPTTYGGIELLLKLLVDEQVARGHDVTLFASADCQTRGKLHAVTEVNLGELFERGEGYMFEYYANAVTTEVLRRAREFDVIHFHLSPAWLPLAALSPVPVVFTMHTSPHRDDEWAIRRYPEVEVVGISEHQMHAMGLHLGRPFPIVHNGCDFDAYDPVFEPGEYLAFLGRMSDGKNPRDAIRIAQAVGMPIVLAGRPQNADEERYFAKEVKPLIDGKNVRWIGPVNHPQKNELLRRAAALIFPIQWDEPFGLVMIEAMACGCPVVAHRRGSVAEVVDNGITGFHTGVIDAMAELVPSAINLDRQKVRDHARERFGYQRMVDAYRDIYLKLLKRGD